MTVYKMLDVVGTSRTGVSDAVRAAIERAGQTIQDMDWFEVKEIRGRLEEGEVAEYQVKVEIGFRLHSAGKGTGDLAGKKKGDTTPQARSIAAQTAAKSGQKKRSDLAKGFEKQPGKRTGRGSSK